MSDINLIAPISFLGYGIVGYNILKALVEDGNSVSYFPIGNPDWIGDSSFSEMIKNCTEASYFYNPNATSVRIWHQFELDMFPGKGKRIGWPIFELNKFNAREMHQLKSVDELIVCSEWGKDVIRSNGIDVPVHVVNLGVDEKIFFMDKNDRASRPVWTRDATVFINVGKWEKRKGHEELLEAFNLAFEDGDNVELWMLNENPFIGAENDVWRKKYVSSKMGRHCKFIPRLDQHGYLKIIFNHVDCGVFPSHAEGWNLEIPEMMACGAHIIATNYSGHAEFLTDENSFKLDITGVETAEDGKWFHGQGEWATFDTEQLVEHMREVHRRKQSGELNINTAGIETAKGLTWKNSVKKLVSIL